MIKDNTGNPRDLAIVETYDAALAYLYPILQDFPRRHGRLRDDMIGMAGETVGLLYQAAKSRQASRLYAADAHLATLRYWLRFAARLRLISHRQHEVALAHIAETGAMLGQWIKTAQGKGRPGI